MKCPHCNCLETFQPYAINPELRECKRCAGMFDTTVKSGNPVTIPSTEALEVVLDILKDEKDSCDSGELDRARAIEWVSDYLTNELPKDHTFRELLEGAKPKEDNPDVKQMVAVTISRNGYVQELEAKVQELLTKLERARSEKN